MKPMKCVLLWFTVLTLSILFLRRTGISLDLGICWHFISFTEIFRPRCWLTQCRRMYTKHCNTICLVGFCPTLPLKDLTLCASFSMLSSQQPCEVGKAQREWLTQGHPVSLMAEKGLGPGSPGSSSDTLTAIPHLLSKLIICVAKYNQMCVESLKFM